MPENSLTARLEKRRFCTLTVDCAIHQRFNGGDDEQTLKAITTNISDKGICLYINRPLSEGTMISVASKSLWTNPRPLKVVWCRKASKTCFKVGLEFCELMEAVPEKPLAQVNQGDYNPDL